MDIRSIIEKVKEKIMTIGKAAVGNLVDEPIVKVPKDDEIQKMYNEKNSTNDNKNWDFLFKQKEIIKDVQNKIREDIYNNDFEMILIEQTVIANRYLDELLTTKDNLKLKQFFVYHGTGLNAHQNIVKKQCFMLQNEGWYGQGVYATDNLVYASLYCNNYRILACNEKARILCCTAIYNDSQIVDIHDIKTYYNKPISNNVKQNCGMHRVLVGSGNNFEPIKDNEKDGNYISANEFVFPNTFQIIPIYSFTVMRKNHYILWKDENIDNSENTTYIKQLQKKMEVNIYGVDSVQKALDIINKKKRNKIKLLTNAGNSLSGVQLINEARKIIGSNFVCLVFTRSRNHLDWATKMENVLLTTSAASFRKFAELDLDENQIIDFAHELEEKHDCKFNINRNELLNFPVNNIYAHDLFYRST